METNLGESEDHVERRPGVGRCAGAAQAEGDTDAHRARDCVAHQVPMEVPPGCVDAGDPVTGWGFWICWQPIGHRFQDCRSRACCFLTRVVGGVGIGRRLEDFRCRVCCYRTRILGLGISRRCQRCDRSCGRVRGTAGRCDRAQHDQESEHFGHSTWTLYQRLRFPRPPVNVIGGLTTLRDPPARMGDTHHRQRRLSQLRHTNRQHHHLLGGRPVASGSVEAG